MEKLMLAIALVLILGLVFASCNLLTTPETPANEDTNPDPAIERPEEPVPNEREETPDEPTQGDVEEAEPHEHTWDEGVETKAPTCAEESEKTFTCTICGETTTEIIEKVEHTWDNGVETKPATLTQEGVKTFTCTICGETKTEAIPIIGSNMSDGTGGGGGSSGGESSAHTHTWNDGEVTTAATCEAAGVKTYTCTGCNETKTEEIPATGHTEVVDAAVLATCTETGLTEGKHCSVCSAVLVAQTTVPVVEHTWDSGVVTTAATCEATGVMTYTCSVCSGTKTDTIAKLNHAYGGDNICDLCGYKTESKGLSFHSNGNGTCSVKDVGVCTDSEIVIPSVSPAGDSVTSIDTYAFNGCSSLISITIPGSVKSISGIPFSGCTSLVGIDVAAENPVYHSAGNCIIETAKKALIIGCKNSVIPSDGSVTSINSCAFYNCTSLTEITIPDSVQSIGSQAFYNCSSIESVTIPESVQSIGDFAFESCTSLSTIIVPDSVTSFGLHPFNCCNMIISATIPATLISDFSAKYNLQTVIITGTTSIPYEAFYNCTNLTSVTIESGVTGVEGSAFEGCSNLLSIVIPDSVTEIGSSAFLGCSSLVNIIIPDGVTQIGNDAFQECTSLVSIAIPNNVTRIGSGAFSKCSSLQNLTIPFVGLQAQVSSSHPEQSLLGYMFGRSSFEGGVLTEQRTYNNVTDNVILFSAYIPSSLKTVAVTSGLAIPYGAFSNCSGLTSVTLSDGITNIGDTAFSGCSSLMSISIPESIASVKSTAFSRCANLQFNTYGNAQYLGTIQNPYHILITASDTSITDCIVHPSTKIIAEAAFSGCSALQSVTLGDKVKSIGFNAFYKCTSLQYNTYDDVMYLGTTANPYYALIIGSSTRWWDYGTSIHANTKAVAEGAFSNCQVWNFNVPAESTVYHSAGNCLIETESKTLVAGCYKSKIPTDGSVTSIGNYAFYGISLSQADGTIPTSIKVIGEGAFRNCTYLPSNFITYHGSTSEWQAVIKIGSWKSNMRQISCNDGKINE